jgi:hypothetical protein
MPLLSVASAAVNSARSGMPRACIVPRSVGTVAMSAPRLAACGGSISVMGNGVWRAAPSVRCR